MCKVMPHPCMGPCSSVFRTRSAKVPCKMSVLRFSIPIDNYREYAPIPELCQAKRYPAKERADPLHCRAERKPRFFHIVDSYFIGESAAGDHAVRNAGAARSGC